MAHSLQTELLGLSNRGRPATKPGSSLEGQGNAFLKVLTGPDDNIAPQLSSHAIPALAKTDSVDADQPAEFPAGTGIAVLPEPQVTPQQSEHDVAPDLSHDDAQLSVPLKAVRADENLPTEEDLSTTTQTSADEESIMPTAETRATGDEVIKSGTAGHPEIQKAEHQIAPDDKVDAKVAPAEAATSGAAMLVQPAATTSSTKASRDEESVPTRALQLIDGADETVRPAHEKEVPRLETQPSSAAVDSAKDRTQNAPSPNASGNLEAVADKSGQATSAIDAAPTPISAGPATPAPTAQSAGPIIAPQTPPAGTPVIAVPEDVVDIVRTRLASSEPSDRITVQLDPPELGRVSIDFKFDAQGLQHVTITGDSPEALKQLRQLHFQLTQALEQQGLSANDMTFRQNSSQQGHAQSVAYPPAREADDDDVVAAQLAPVTRQARLPDGSGAGLNIKL